MQAGDHIYVSRLGGIYAHHGIYCGDDEFHQELSLLDAGAVASYVHGSGLEGPSAAVSTG